MEVYAGFIAHTDLEIGRLLDAVQNGPGSNNTLILYIVGDNGACADGGPNGFTDAITSIQDQLKHLDELGSPLVASNIYSAGWAWLGATPFKGWKWDAAHFGGVRNPLIVSWPARIRDLGALRTQFTHVNDVAATLYDVTGIRFPSVVDIEWCIHAERSHCRSRQSPPCSSRWPAQRPVVRGTLSAILSSAIRRTKVGCVVRVTSPGVLGLHRIRIDGASEFYFGRVQWKCQRRGENVTLQV
jgi:hypothetical protein